MNKNISAITSQSITQKLLSENPSTSISEGDTAETIAPYAIEASKNKTYLQLSPQEFAKARKAQKKAQRDRAAAMEAKPLSFEGLMPGLRRRGAIADIGGGYSAFDPRKLSPRELDAFCLMLARKAGLEVGGVA